MEDIKKKEGLDCIVGVHLHLQGLPPPVFFFFSWLGRNTANITRGCYKQGSVSECGCSLAQDSAHLCTHWPSPRSFLGSFFPPACTNPGDPAEKSSFSVLRCCSSHIPPAFSLSLPLHTSSYPQLGRWLDRERGHLIQIKDINPKDTSRCIS